MTKRISALSLIAGLALALAPSASAQTLAFSPCKQIEGFSCATLAVPLDRQAALPGTIPLHIARKLAGATPSTDAVIGLAGGPGQAALPLAGGMAKLIAPALASRDLIVFDQRGTGESGPLSCGETSTQRANAISASANTISVVVADCAQQIGPSRSGYSTAESVQDIEAIREAAGYEKLVLYGTSYGTKVAEQYAQTYPSHVEALVLDSVVPPEGDEPFHRASFEAIPRVISEACSHRTCRHIAPHPVAGLAQLVHSRIGRKDSPLGGWRALAEQRSDLLFALLLDGDLDPELRAMLPAAVHTALGGHDAQFNRLVALITGQIPRLPHHRHLTATSDEVDSTLYLDTTCEDTPFPWSRSSTPTQRAREAKATLAAMPQTAFQPLLRSAALDASAVELCAGWPYAGPTPSAPGPLPNVPTLILSGAQDLRTPTANARAVAAQIPDAQLLVVPYTGHSVLGNDASGCAEDAVRRFFAGSGIQPCRKVQDHFPPSPLQPRSVAALKAFHGVAGKPGRTLAAVLATVAQFDAEYLAGELTIGRRLPAGSDFPGLAKGNATLGHDELRFAGYSFVPGLELTGRQSLRKDGIAKPGRVGVAGRGAAAGYVVLGERTRIRGQLGGKRFSVSLPSADAASAKPRLRGPKPWLRLPQ